MTIVTNKDTIAADQQSTNDWKVAGLRPNKLVCITVTGNRMG